MAQETKIQWTDYSANPIRARRRDGGHRIPGHYCEKISPGCALCYASNMQKRFWMPAFPGTGGNDEVEPFLDEKSLQRLLRSKKISGKRVFMCDMTDLFGRWVPDEWIDKIFAVMALRPDVTFQLLTKRPERMAEYLAYTNEGRSTFDHRWNISDKHKRADLGPEDAVAPWPLPNVHLGASVENQEQADKRIPHLLRCPAAVRFLSVEPLLGAVDLGDHFARWHCSYCGALYAEYVNGCPRCHFGEPGTSTSVRHTQIHWVIVGGESGSKARPCNVEWIRSIVKQCRVANVPVFCKQLGALPYYDDGSDGINAGNAIVLRDRKGGDFKDLPSDLQIRETPR